MKLTLFGMALTRDAVVVIALSMFAVLMLSAFAILLDKKAWREPPHYMLPCRGTAYFAVLILSALLLVGVLFLKLKYFP